MNLREAVIQHLQSNPGQKFKAQELALWIMETFPDDMQEKLQTSSYVEDETGLRNQLVAEIGSNRPRWEAKHPQLKTTAERPRLYYWTDKSDEEEAQAASEGTSEISTSSPQTSEAMLYPALCEYLYGDRGVYSMRIDEKTASNKKGSNGNRWLFPDICGLQDLVAPLHKDVKSLINLVGDTKANLWSLEVKLLINPANVREAFFQTVSNSSWANYAYLVAAQIDDKAMDELNMLHGLHGVGLIQLNYAQPDESQVLIPAVKRANVDWLAFSRLASECGDFRKFSKLVRHFYQTDETSPNSWGLKPAI